MLTLDSGYKIHYSNRSNYTNIVIQSLLLYWLGCLQHSIFVSHLIAGVKGWINIIPTIPDIGKEAPAR